MIFTAHHTALRWAKKRVQRRLPAQKVKHNTVQGQNCGTASCCRVCRAIWRVLRPLKSFEAQTMDPQVPKLPGYSVSVPVSADSSGEARRFSAAAR
jgi:hypothetical protein